MRRAARIDQNQPEIIAELKARGFSVLDMSSLGNGSPDIAVGSHKANYFFEIKNPNVPKSDRQLTDKERAFHEAWRGQVDVVHSADEVLEAIKRALGI